MYTKLNNIHGQLQLTGCTSATVDVISRALSNMFATTRVDTLLHLRIPKTPIQNDMFGHLLVNAKSGCILENDLSSK